MRILIVPSWYTSHDNIMGNGGIFHYEQAREMAKEHTVAIYYPLTGRLQKIFKQKKREGF